MIVTTSAYGFLLTDEWGTAAPPFQALVQAIKESAGAEQGCRPNDAWLDDSDWLMTYPSDEGTLLVLGLCAGMNEAGLPAKWRTAMAATPKPIADALASLGPIESLLPQFEVMSGRC